MPSAPWQKKAQNDLDACVACKLAADHYTCNVYLALVEILHHLVHRGSIDANRRLFGGLAFSPMGECPEDEAIQCVDHLLVRRRGWEWLFSGAGGTIIKKLKKRGERGGRLAYVHVR